MSHSPISAAGTIALVGNAPHLASAGAEIDQCDTIVRFNNAPGFGGAAGRRVTHLALVNRGGQPGEWVGNGFADLAALRAAPDIILPFPRLDDGPAGICWTVEMARALAPFGVRTRTLDDALHKEAREALREHGARGRIDPSTGFLVAFDLLSRQGAEGRMRLFGFGFAGWDGHPWDAERRWFAEQGRLGRLELRATAADTSA